MSTKNINLNGIDLTATTITENNTYKGGNITSKTDNDLIRLNSQNLCVETSKNGGTSWEPCGKNYYNLSSGTFTKGGEIFNNYTNNIASGQYSHAEGQQTNATNTRAHAEGLQTTASGNNSHAEGYHTTASIDSSHAEGYYTAASGSCSHSEGYFTTASGQYSHAEGEGSNTSKGDINIYNGTETITYSITQKKGEASGDHGSHCEGHLNVAIGDCSHVEGSENVSLGSDSHAEGGFCYSLSSRSHAEGSYTIAGKMTKSGDVYSISGEAAHAEGYHTLASGENSHAEGNSTEAKHDNSHAGGVYTRTSRNNQTVIGEYNADSINALFIVGNGAGTSSSLRNNAFIVNSNGSIAAEGGGSFGGNIYIARGGLTIGSLTLTSTTSSSLAELILTSGELTLNSGYLKLKQVGNSATDFGEICYHRGSGGSNGDRHWIFSSLNLDGGMFTWQKNDERNKWYKLERSTNDPPTCTINHISMISNNTNLNNYKIGEPIFLNNKYKKYNYNLRNYINNFSEIKEEKIEINNSTGDTTLFDITNNINNNFVGICSMISEPKIIKRCLEEPFNLYSIKELTQEEITELNLNVNDLPEDYLLVYKVYNYNNLNNPDPYTYYDQPVIAFATHGDYMFYVNDTEALIDTNLNTQKYYEIGDELTYDGKILILPEFNPNNNLTESQQLQELIDYNKKLSDYNKLKKNSIGKISHIFSSQECDDYKHYLAIFKTN